MSNSPQLLSPEVVPSPSTFIFICQKGDLEVMAALLAATLRRHVASTHTLIAVIPGPEQVLGSPKGAAEVLGNSRTV